MAKHYSHYVFWVQNYGKLIVAGLNEKEARRNLIKTSVCPELDCPKAELLSVHGSFLDALEWRANDNKKDR